VLFVKLRVCHVARFRLERDMVVQAHVDESESDEEERNSPATSCADSNESMDQRSHNGRN